MGLTIGVDLGGTQLRVGVVDANGHMVAQKSGPTDAHLGPEHVIDRMQEWIQSFAESFDIEAVGVGAPGPLDPQQGVIYAPPNLPGWDAVPLVQRLEQRVPYRVTLDNDANAAALAEALFGAGKNADSVLYITVSTGIGAGIVLNGRIFQGEHGFAGEVGNMIIVPDGPRHAEMNPGCLEAVASGTAIAREGRARINEKCDTKEVFTRAKNGEQAASQIVDEFTTYLSIGLANLLHTLNPADCVVGGGVMQSKDLILPDIISKVQSYMYPGMKKSVRIEAAALGSSAGLVGAASLPRQNSPLFPDQQH
jgi:glucokinase